MEVAESPSNNWVCVCVCARANTNAYILVHMYVFLCTNIEPCNWRGKGVVRYLSCEPFWFKKRGLIRVYVLVIALFE